MNLFHLLAARREAGRLVRAGLSGAGKFGSMFLAQVPTIPGLHVSVIADLNPARARRSCRTVGWDETRIAATAFLDSGSALAARDDVEVVIEATGSPSAGILHARAAAAAGKHVVMVNVEADVLAGPLLADEARRAGVVYSLAYGDQPALTAELVDWARSSGFRVVAAGTKSAIEMAAIANACDLDVPSDGLCFPPCGVDDLAHVLRPRDAGGVLERTGMVEVVSSLERDSRPVFRDLRWGVYVVIEATTDYAAACFRQYGLKTDASGRYAAMYKPFHLIGMELSISVLSAALRGEPTGAPTGFRGDVVAVAKRDIAAGETLDGEGGFTVWGKLLPAARSLALSALPIGLAHGVAVNRHIARGDVVPVSAVSGLPPGIHAVRREMEHRFAPSPSGREASHSLA